MIFRRAAVPLLPAIMLTLLVWDAIGLAGGEENRRPLTRPIESVDRWLNRYWVEFSLLYPERSCYNNVWPQLTANHDSTLDQVDPIPTARLLQQRLARELRMERDLLNRVLGLRRRPGRVSSYLRLRLAPYFQEITAEDSAPIHRGGISAETWLASGDYWQLHVRARLENHGELYPQFAGRVWKDKLTGWVDNAALYFYSKGFFGSIGRSFMLWGPELGDALLLSGNSPAFDRLWLGYEHRVFRFDYFLTRLDDIVTRDTTMFRYLAAHRLSFRKPGWFELGLSEIVVFGGANRPLEWRYLNPFLPYYWEQWNARTDDNILIGLDLAVYWPERSRLFAELLIDDFQIDFESEPHQVGYKLGLDTVEPFDLSRLFARFSYTRVNTTVYGHGKIRNLYLHHGEPIGYFGGNDQDRLLALFRYHLSHQFDLEVEMQYNRRGEGGIEQFETSGVPFAADFPTGIIEKSSSISLRFDFFVGQYLEGYLLTSYDRIENFDHHENAEHDRLALNLLIAWYLAGSLL